MRPAPDENSIETLSRLLQRAGYSGVEDAFGLAAQLGLRLRRESGCTPELRGRVVVFDPGHPEGQQQRDALIGVAEFIATQRLGLSAQGGTSLVLAVLLDEKRRSGPALTRARSRLPSAS